MERRRIQGLPKCSVIQTDIWRCRCLLDVTFERHFCDAPVVIYMYMYADNHIFTIQSVQIFHVIMPKKTFNYKTP